VEWKQYQLCSATEALFVGANICRSLFIVDRDYPPPDEESEKVVPVLLSTLKILGRVPLQGHLSSC
jgi:hypothetical protein